ncbi:MAG: c-type cytochrome [Gammaproteobacteria bacterium]
MPSRKILSILLGSGLLLGAAHVAAAPTGQALADTCAGCHGTDGASAGPASPSIAGLSETYFVDSMKAFKSGDRPSTIMGRIAKGYSDEEIAAMAAVFAKQPMATTKQKTDPAKVAAGKALHEKSCEKCHSENGSVADDDAGILASQWAPYLKYSLQDTKAGTRNMPKKMTKKVNALSDADIDALVHFYASQQ